LVDAVGKVRSWFRRKLLIEAEARGCRSSYHRRLPCQADLGELAQVLGGCGEILTDALNAWLERKADVLTEMLGLFILRHQLTLVADQPPFDSDTARLGRFKLYSIHRHPPLPLPPRISGCFRACWAGCGLIFLEIGT
jgi:hypothetical protein